MTIEIHKRELEDLIRTRLESGAFESVEDVLLDALRAAPPRETPASRPEKEKNLADLLADSPFRGLAMDFERFPDNREEITLQIQEGWDEAQNGELTDADQVRAEMRQYKEDWLKQRGPA